MESRGGKDLHSAARSGDLISVQAIVASNPLAVNSRDKHSRTPLHMAAWSGQTEVVSYLCKHKADVGATAMDDMGAVHFAAQKGHLEVVRILVSFGVSVKTCTRKGFTPLHYATQGSHMELVKYLAKKGSSLVLKTKAGKTPLDLATSDEIRTFLEEYQHSSKKRNIDAEQETKKPDPTSLCPDGEESSGVENVTDKEKAEKKDDSLDKAETLPRPKRAKVALGHLHSSDDFQESGENL